MPNKIGCVIAYKKNHTNFGTSLVGYALLKILRQRGYEIAVINYIKRPTLVEMIRIATNQLRVKGLKKMIRFAPRTANAEYAKGIRERTRRVEAYKALKIEPLFHNYTGFAALCEGSKNYDTVLVGSDQVWLPMGLKTRFFNLLFVDDRVRKVSYASSFGVSEIPRFQRKETGDYLNRFYAISVREQSGKEIVEALSNKKATVVADPTLLLNADEWREESQHSQVNEPEPYIFCYFLGRNPEAREAANELKAATGYKIITLRHMDEFVERDESFGDEAPYDVDPDDFIQYIRCAAYVCTDSFHCTAFSIQFHKSFMTFYRFAIGQKGGRNSRIDSLFQVLAVPRDHIYAGKIAMIDSPIDWGAVDSKLEEFRNRSLQFLIRSLREEA